MGRDGQSGRKIGHPTHILGRRIVLGFFSEIIQFFSAYLFLLGDRGTRTGSVALPPQAPP